MSYFSDLHITGQEEGYAGMHGQLTRDFMRLGRSFTEARKAADEILAPKAALPVADLDDEGEPFDENEPFDDDNGYDSHYGTPCAPKCELCGRAMDECRCFGGDDE